MKKIKNIVIVGGGTAGWLTALFIKKIIPYYNVTVISDEKIGIIGVGEATTINFINFLNFLNINWLNLIKETKGSIKNGINFQNWNGDNKKYFHGFFEKNKMDPFYIPNIFSHNCLDYYYRKLIKENLNFNEYSYSAKLSYENKIDFNNINHAIHFDTNLVSIYLKNISLSRGIKHLEGTFNNVVTNKNNFIKEILLKNNIKIKCDFVFDCSGFSRLILGNYYKTKWISYKNNLPMKKAIPFYLEEEKDIEPYTSAIAMKYGWIWKIPLQHRIGSGYIFDSNYINEEQALLEAEKFFNKKLKVNKIISFEAGRYEKFWVKNCIAIGLSSTFIEPLESTSIMLSVSQLENLSHFLNNIFDYEEKSVALYNDIVNKNMEETLSFVYMHYLTKRKDSLFWKNFKKNNPIPKHFVEKLEIIKENNLRFFNSNEVKTTCTFPVVSFLQVCNGLKLFKKKIKLSHYENLKPSIKEYKKLIDVNLKIAETNKEFLKKL
jgi:tryptophan halogenase